MGYCSQADGEAVTFDDRVKAARAAAAVPRPSLLAALAMLELRSGQAVLDAGCGPGLHLRLFAEAVGPAGMVTGLDRAADELEIAAILCDQSVQTPGAAQIRLRQGDITALPFPARSFDVVWISAVLHHLEDPRAALIELSRVLRPRGLIAVLDADLTASFPVLPWSPQLEESLRVAAVRAAADADGDYMTHHFDAYLGRRLPRLMREANLCQVTLHALPEVDQSPLSIERKVEIRNWFLGPFLERIGDYLAPVDRAAMVAAFNSERPDYLLSEPDCFLLRTWLLVTGRRAP